MWGLLSHRFRLSILNDMKRGYSIFSPESWQPVYIFDGIAMPGQWARRLSYSRTCFGRRCGELRSSIVLSPLFRLLKCGVISTQQAPLVSFPTPSNLSPGHLTKELRDFKDRLRSLGPGKVDISLDDKNGLAKLTLANQDRRNAPYISKDLRGLLSREHSGVARSCWPRRGETLTGRMMVQLSEAVDALESWERGVALTLEGADGSFCSGADLSLAREHLITGEDGRLMCALMTNTLERLRRLPLISVAVVDGSAIGGGAELSTCCDFRIAGPESVIRFVQVKMGVSTGWGGGARLTGIVGRRTALRLLAWSPNVTAAEGLSIGLLDAVASEQGGAGVKAREFLAGVLERQAYGAVRAVKSVVAATDSVPPTVRDAEEDQFAALWGSTDNRIALKKSSSRLSPKR